MSIERLRRLSGRRLNRSLVLRALTERDHLSRAELARTIGLSKSTVSSIVDQLIADGFVTATGHGHGARGRRPELLRFMSHARYAIGVELANTHARAFLTDLDAQPLRSESIERTVEGPAAAAAMAAEAVERVRRGLDAGAILGVGAGTPGLVDPRHGVIETAPDLGWRRVQVGAMLAEQTGLPTLVSNRATCAGMGEHWRGAGRGARAMVYVSVNTGIAAGIVIGGALYRGATMSEGQLGHVTIEPDGPVCGCGSRGCLQLYAAGPALLAEARAQARLDPASQFHASSDGDLSHLTLAGVGQAVAEGDAAALRALERTGRYLGIGIAHLVNLLNPDVVVLGGAVIQAALSAIAFVRREVDARAFPATAAAVRIVPAELGTSAVGLGAAALLLTEWRHAELGPSGLDTARARQYSAV